MRPVLQKQVANQASFHIDVTRFYSLFATMVSFLYFIASAELPQIGKERKHHKRNLSSVSDVDGYAAEMGRLPYPPVFVTHLFVLKLSTKTRVRLVLGYHKYFQCDPEPGNQSKSWGVSFS